MPEIFASCNGKSNSIYEYSFILSEPGKTRTKEKYRVVYTDHQRLELEKEFHCNRYITIRRKSELAANLGLSERQVQRAPLTQVCPQCPGNAPARGHSSSHLLPLCIWHTEKLPHNPTVINRLI